MIEAALMCLALNVYFEARSDTMTGQYAVAHVVINRVQSTSSQTMYALWSSSHVMMARASLAGTAMVNLTDHVSRMHGPMPRW